MKTQQNQTSCKLIYVLKKVNTVFFMLFQILILWRLSYQAIEVISEERGIKPGFCFSPGDTDPNTHQFSHGKQKLVERLLAVQQVQRKPLVEKHSTSVWPPAGVPLPGTAQDMWLLCLTPFSYLSRDSQTL